MLFIGYLDKIENVEKYPNLSTAGLNYQINLLEALNNISNLDLHVVSYRPIPSFPNGPIITKTSMSDSNTIEVTNLGFVNIPVLKSIIFQKKLHKHIIKLLKRDKIDTILCFNYYLSFANPLKKISKKYDIPVIPILADLPISHLKNSSMLSTIIHNFINKKSIKNLKNIKQCVVLNRNAAKIYAPESKYILVEGGINQDLIQHWDRNRIKSKTFLYAGSLDYYSGIDIFISAFNQVSLSHDIYLKICGSGELENRIKSLIKNNSKIDFLGKISNKDVIDLEKKSFCVVNPKIIFDEISRVTFPSKIHEYMTNNSHIISSKLDGIDEKYFDKMILIERDDVISHRDAIEKAINTKKKEIQEKSYLIKDFISNSLTWERQAKRVVDFIEELTKGN